MPWARIDDTFHDHPKTVDLLDERDGVAAIGLFTLLLSYCNRHLTDGAFSAVIAKRLCKRDALLPLLVKHGMVEASGDGFRIHDFLSYSKSREKVQSERDAWTERQRRSRGVTDVSRRDNGVSHAPVTRTSHSPVPVPVPVPVPGAPSEHAHGAPAAGEDPDDDLTTLQKLAETMTGESYGFARDGTWGVKVATLLRKHGRPSVEREWRRIAAEERGMPTIRQLVLGADNALNPLPSSGKPMTEAERKDAEIAAAIAQIKAETKAAVA